MSFSDLPRSARYAHLASIFRPPDAPGAYISSSLEPDLARAYWRLFQGPGRPLAQPYESVHLEGRLMGEAADRVVQCYSEAGIELQDCEHQLPDHISLELAFMAFLARQEEAQTTGAVIWRARQRRFLHEHLARWVASFAEQVGASQTDPLFAHAADGVRQLIDADILQIDRPAAVKRYPNVNIELLPASCTLCTLCVDGCRQGALSVQATPEALRLLFEPRRCNGCRACLRLCPEKAIRLVLNSPRSEPLEDAVHILSTAQRVICPGCSRPHIARSWLERLVEQLGCGAEMRSSLELCPVCKANAHQKSTTMETISYG